MDKKLASKIQKLLALGAGNNAEAKSAMNKAGKLMADNNIGLEDISNGTIKPDGIIEELVNISSKNILIWEINLAHALCKAFDCQCLKQVLFGQEQRLFLGTKSDLKLLMWYYKYLRIKVAREAEVKFKLVKDQKAFGMGAVTTLTDRILDMFTSKQQAMTNDTKALVVVKTDAVSKHIHDNYKLRAGRKMRLTNINTKAMAAGQAAGNRISINRPIARGKPSSKASMVR